MSYFNLVINWSFFESYNSLETFQKIYDLWRMEDFYKTHYQNQSSKSDAMATVVTGISQFDYLRTQANLPNQNMVPDNGSFLGKSQYENHSVGKYNAEVADNQRKPVKFAESRKRIFKIRKKVQPEINSELKKLRREKATVRERDRSRKLKSAFEKLR